MPSAVRPTNVSRVTMLMRSNLLMSGIRTNSVDLLKVQNQLTTGLKLARPSDGPAEASTILHLDGVLENQKQYMSNIDYSLDFLAATDNALGQAGELTDEVYSLALGSIGRDSDEAENNAVIIDQILQQLINIGNYTCRGSYVFAGQNSITAPFESHSGGVLFAGDLAAVQTRVAQRSLVNFSVNGDDAFGSLSSQVQGIADLSPDITNQTLLTELNGSLNQGIRLGSIIVGDGTNTNTIDLGACITVGDVINTLNDQVPATTTATIGADGTSLQISSTLGGANVTVAEVGTGYTARDLGIHDTAGSGAALTGQDVDARLLLTTPVTVLAGGAGIDTVNGLKISNSLLAQIDPIDLSTAQSLGDILNAINNADIGVRAEINTSATGINILNQLSGSEMTIGENSGTTAADLGIRSLTGSTSLADLNGGKGVATSNDSGDGIVRITARDGSTYDINLSTASTVQDAIDLINAGCAGHVTATLTSTDNGIELIDTVGGAGDFGVTTVSENGYFVASQLGFCSEQGDGLSVSSDTLTGEDPNPIKPDGLFSDLIALYNAMLINDNGDRDAAISEAAEAIQADRKNLSNYRGMVGSTMQAVEGRRAHMEDNILATQTLRSDIADIDFTEAITRYQNLYTALQGNLMTGSQLTNVSLLDFLR